MVQGSNLINNLIKLATKYSLIKFILLKSSHNNIVLTAAQWRDTVHPWADVDRLLLKKGKSQKSHNKTHPDGKEMHTN